MVAKLLISASIDARTKKINEFLAKRGILNPHPDLLIFPQDLKLGIDQARKIKAFFATKPYSSKGKAVVLEEGSSLTNEAQNALLKTLEELPEKALFIIGADSESKFLPTILSRCEIIRIEDSRLKIQDSRFTEDIEKLLNANIAERFEYVEKLKKKEEFLHALINYFYKKLPDSAAFLKDLSLAEEWEQQNVNIRAILEYLMLKMS